METHHSIEEICQLGRGVIEQELEQAKRLLNTLNQSFADTCQAILTCSGKVIVTGIGKSGHIGKKIAATLASTGSRLSSFIRQKLYTVTWAWHVMVMWLS